MRSVVGMPRMQFYRAQAAQMLLLTVFSLFVAWHERIDLFPRALPSRAGVLAALALLALQFAVGVPMWRQAVREQRPIVWLIMPQDRSQRIAWTGIAALAGFGEEVTWRGVQTVLLTRYTGALLLAAAAAVVMFAAAHAVQSLKSVFVVALFAAGFHVVVWLSGSLYMAMLIHFLYDAAAGFGYARIARPEPLAG